MMVQLKPQGPTDKHGVRKVHLSGGQELFGEGDVPRALYQVELGAIKLVRSSTTGRDSVVEVLGVGDFFDLPSLLDGEAYMVGAYACASGPVRVARIEREIALQDSALVRDAQKQYLTRLRFQRRMAAAIATERVEHRALLALEMLAQRWGIRYEPNRLAFPMPLSRQEFGELIGTTTETAIRVLSDLRKKGWLQEDQRLITLYKLCETLESRVSL